MNTTLKKLGGLLAILVTISMCASGCTLGKAEASDQDATPFPSASGAQVACDQIPAQMDPARVDLAEASQKLAEAKDAAAKQTEQSKVDAAQTKVDELQKQLDQCGIAYTAEQAAATAVCYANQATVPAPTGDEKKDNEVILTACKEYAGKLLESIPEANRGEASDGASATFHKNVVSTTSDLDTATQSVGTLAAIAQAVASGKPAEGFVAQVESAFPNATKDDVEVGAKAIDWKKVGNQRGATAFSPKTFKSAKDLGAWLCDASNPTAKAAYNKAVAAIKKVPGVNLSREIVRMCNGNGYLPVKVKGISQVLNTSYILNGKVQVAPGWRQAAANDVYWLFITESGYIVLGASFRAACGNPGFRQIIVKRPGMPEAPPIDLPPGKEKCPPGTTYNPKTGKCDVPKSNDPQDYVYPGNSSEGGTGTRPRSRVDGRADRTPPDVETKTSRDSGGGSGSGGRGRTEDRASNLPGSESGAKAPGADTSSGSGGRTGDTIPEQEKGTGTATNPEKGSEGSSGEM